MAYYDALKAKWPSITGATTQAKLDNLNALTQAGAGVPMVIPTYMIYNLIVGAEFAALTAANQQLIRDILSMGTVDASPGTQIRARIVAIFPSTTTTYTNLAALAARYDSPSIPWWQANGYPAPISLGDLALAGLSGSTWNYQVNSVLGPDSAGASTASVDFWSNANPSVKYNRSVTSITLTDAEITSWAIRVARDMATREALAAGITTGTSTVVGA